jgi:hypothetical protein
MKKETKQKTSLLSWCKSGPELHVNETWWPSSMANWQSYWPIYFLKEYHNLTVCSTTRWSLFQQLDPWNGKKDVMSLAILHSNFTLFSDSSPSQISMSGYSRFKNNENNVVKSEHDKGNSICPCRAIGHSDVSPLKQVFNSPNAMN